MSGRRCNEWGNNRSDHGRDGRLQQQTTVDVHRLLPGLGQAQTLGEDLGQSDHRVVVLRGLDELRFVVAQNLQRSSAFGGEVAGAVRDQHMIDLGLVVVGVEAVGGVGGLPGRIEVVGVQGRHDELVGDSHNGGAGKLELFGVAGGQSGVGIRGNAVQQRTAHQM